METAQLGTLQVCFCINNISQVKVYEKGLNIFIKLLSISITKTLAIKFFIGVESHFDASALQSQEKANESFDTSALQHQAANENTGNNLLGL